MHATFKGYMTGFILSVILTAIPFWVVMAKVFDKLGPYRNLAGWLGRMHARPAFQQSIAKGGPYRFA